MCRALQMYSSLSHQSRTSCIWRNICFHCCCWFLLFLCFSSSFFFFLNRYVCNNCSTSSVPSIGHSLNDFHFYELDMQVQALDIKLNAIGAVVFCHLHNEFLVCELNTLMSKLRPGNFLDQLGLVDRQRIGINFFFVQVTKNTLPFSAFIRCLR